MEKQSALLCRYRSEINFAVLFLLLFGGLHAIYSLFGSPVISHLLIDELTVKPCAFLINSISSQERVQALGHSLVSPLARLNVLNGCEGVEGILLIAAALFSYNLALQAKLKGVLLATALLYTVNQMRITALYFAYRYDRSFFEIIHEYIGPTLIMVIGALFFLWWVSRHPRVEL